MFTTEQIAQMMAAGRTVDEIRAAGELASASTGSAGQTAAPAAVKPTGYRAGLEASASKGSKGAAVILRRLDSLIECRKCGRKFGPASSGIGKHLDRKTGKFHDGR